MRSVLISTLDPLGVPQQQIALLARFGVSKLAVGLVGAHLLDPYAHGAQAREHLQRVEFLFAIAAVSAARITGNWANQPDLLVIAQRRLTEPAPAGCVLDCQSWHEASKPDLKRLKSRARLPIPPPHRTCRRTGVWKPIHHCDLGFLTSNT